MYALRWAINTFKLLLLCVLAIPGLAAAQADYEQMQVKADRLFSYDDWIPAGALYNYMLAERPTVADTYGRAIVCASAAGDSLRSMQLLAQAQEHHVPLESVLRNLESYAFAKSRAGIYEAFLHQASSHFPWLERPLQPYLLDYYTFRRNGPEMVRYARIMLAGMPTSPRYLQALAQGQMLMGHTQEAIEAWRQILAQHPADFDALVNLAACLALTGKPDEALATYRQAYAVRPTPYVAQRIAQLQE